MTLRPTGMIVFATLETTPGAVGRPAAPGVSAFSDPISFGSQRVMARPSPAILPTTPGSTHQWRRRAWRGVAWLLGR